MRRNLNRLALGLAVVVPLAVALVLAPFRDRIENTDVALVLVVVVVGVAAFGNRPAGYVAAVSAGAWFNFFFTEPYQRFTIADPSDIETFVLLLIVGILVTELAVWGRRQEAIASREAGYLAGIEAAAEVGATGGSSQALIRQVSAQLVDTLHLRAARYQPGVAGLGNPARLRRDGQIVWKGTVWDVDRRGLPVDTEIELLVENAGRLHGRYLLSATPDSSASLSERRVAVTLADQVGAALS
jgi:K+-sensing histidine kinase KdpD